MEQRLVDINKVKEVTLEDSITFISYTPDNGVDCYIEADTVLTLPENPTNGDMIKAMFPEVKMWGESEQTLDYSLGGMVHRVTKSWWNAPYRKEG